MKLKNDFYFWSSWFLLICLLLLVFHMYQVRFSFQEIIDLKTILTVLGTVSGAYFGAKVAGKYAIESVERQIANTEKKEKKREHNNLLKSLVLYRATSLKLYTFLENLKDVVKKHESFAGGISAFEEDADSLRAIKKFITNELIQLERIDITEIPSEIFFKFTLILSNVKSLLNSVEEMIDAMDKYNPNIYLTYWEFYFSTIKELKQLIDEIDNDLSNIKS
ncbi:hypothetical protein [Planococcus versutus]|uniref:Uncharacterized protein n=1 Tax=Planococcus versutus TaxID=1302659 RepID=A0A1B1S5H5_9BACL|nr:hypothetical protein [Planococcus versutus]ANU28440.1 hypothetical protein I858_015730 [Planococcus versutus]